MATRVLIAGFSGAMGQYTVDLVKHMDGFTFSAGLSPKFDGDNAKYHLTNDVKVYQSLDEIPDDAADVWVDFTTPDAVYDNTKFAVDHGMSPVIGTTGLTDDQEAELIKAANAKQLGGIIAPNFGMSAVLLMKFAAEAAKYFPDVEVIEMHHADKADAPSGTALATAKKIDENRPEHESSPDKVTTLANVRGGDYHGIHIHSVRLPGYIAHEQVLFGGTGEALTIRQDSFDRKSFMSGVKVALQKVGGLKTLVVGLENVL